MFFQPRVIAYIGVCLFATVIPGTAVSVPISPRAVLHVRRRNVLAPFTRNVARQRSIRNFSLGNIGDLRGSERSTGVHPKIKELNFLPVRVFRPPEAGRHVDRPAVHGPDALSIVLGENQGAVQVKLNLVIFFIEHKSHVPPHVISHLEAIGVVIAELLVHNIPVVGIPPKRIPEDAIRLEPCAPASHSRPRAAMSRKQERSTRSTLMTSHVANPGCE
mmetsp:Transcript_21603/g.54518  ORF Transcript_21603/g.54518 Transcript_21603/m.54518 type:complete len:218 (-) Transcript_21603:1601-2254(-)